MSGASGSSTRERSAARFSEAEAAFLSSERLLGRLVTMDGDDWPHVVPVGWSYDPETQTIEVTGRRFAATKKFRNVKADPRVAFIVDDVLPPWRPRCVMVQGTAEAIEPADGNEARIRILPAKIRSWGL